MLKDGASINLYIMYGGTSFGLTSGTNSIYGPFTTAYGNGGPIGVTGFVGEKYYAIRNVIKQFFPLPDVPITQPVKISVPPVQLTPVTTLFSPLSRQTLAKAAVQSQKPLTFEQLRQDVGFVLYETILPKTRNNGNVLNIPKFYDRAYIYVNNVSQVESLTKSSLMELNLSHFGCRHWSIFSTTREGLRRCMFGKVNYCRF